MRRATLLGAMLLAGCLGTGPTGEGPGIQGTPPPPTQPGALPPSIVTNVLPNAIAGQPYQATITASGGGTPQVWFVPAGSLPTGLSLDRVSGMITGTTTLVGTYFLNISLATTLGSAQKQLVLEVQ